MAERQDRRLRLAVYSFWKEDFEGEASVLDLSTGSVRQCLLSKCRRHGIPPVPICSHS